MLNIHKKRFGDTNTKKEFDKMLKSVKVLQDLKELCSKNPLHCEALEKKILCDATLILLGYPNITGFNTCKIYKELNNLMLVFELELYASNIKKVSTRTIEYEGLSANFLNFIKVNGLNFNYNGKLNKAMASMNDLASSPTVDMKNRRSSN